MVDVTDSKSVGGDTVWVRVPPPAPRWMTLPNSNKSMRLANLVGLFYTLKALTWQRFWGLTHHGKSETKRLKPLQIEVENIKVRRFEPHYLIWRSCWSFLPSVKALNSSVCDEVVWYCKTQYRKRHLLEMLYRKDDPFGRALLFSAMRRKILRLRYHAVYPVVKMIALHCAYVRAAGVDGRYTARLGHYEK